MPNIKQYTQQINPSQMVQGRSASPADFGAMEAQALQGLGNAATQLSARVEEIQLRRDRSNYERIMAEHRLELTKKQAELAQTDFEPGVEVYDGYDASFSDMAAGVSQRIPKSMQQQFSVDIENLRTSFVSRGVEDGVRRAAIKDQVNLENTVTSANNRVLLDPSPDTYEAEKASIERQIWAMAGSGEAKQQEINAQVDALRASYAEGVARKYPNMFLEQVKVGEWDDVKNVDVYAGIATASNNAAKAEAQKQQSEYRGLFQSRIELRLAGAKTQQDILGIQADILAEEEVIGEKATNDLLRKTLSSLDTINKDIDLAARGSMFASGEAYLNPADSDDKKAFNAYYENNVEPLLNDVAASAGTPEEGQAQRTAFLLDLIDRVRYVPDRLRGDITSVARGRDVEEIAAASEFIDRLRHVNPHLLSSFNEQDLARIDLVRQFKESGYNSREALDLADKATSPVNQQLRQYRMEELNGLKIDYRDKATDIFNGWFDFGVDINNPASQEEILNLELDYRRAFSSGYLMTGNAEYAEKMANRMVSGQYSATSVNGIKQVMKYAPEKYYHISGVDNTEWIRTQMIDRAKLAYKDTAIPLESIDFEKEIFLVADPHHTPRTARDGAPKYKIMRLSGQEYHDVLGAGVYWAPSVKEEADRLTGAAKEKEKTRTQDTMKEIERLLQPRGLGLGAGDKRD